MSDQKIGVIDQNTSQVVSVDTSAIVRPTDGTMVERERVVLGDPMNFGGLVTVTPNGSLMIDSDLLRKIVSELRAIRTGISIMINQDLDPGQIDVTEN
jgi:hypothetical protein